MTDHVVRPGVVLRHEGGGVVVVDRRKADNSGWWCREAGGVSDEALGKGAWYWVAESVQQLADHRDRLGDLIVARNEEISPEEAQRRRMEKYRIGGDQS